MISIKVDIRGIDAVQAELQRISGEFRRGRAIGAALNKTAQRARAEINRAVVDEYAIKAGDVRNAVYLRSARANLGKLEAVIDVFGSPTRRGRSMNVVRFLAAVQAAGAAHGTRGGKLGKKALNALGRQLGFRFKKSSGAKTIAGAFLANKGRTVFQRTGPARFPIEPVQVIGVSGMFSSRKIRDRVMAKIEADLPVQMRSAVELILRLDTIFGRST